MKTCSKCGRTQELAEFHRCSRNPDGLQRKCRSCCAEYTAANKDKAAAYGKVYRATNRARLVAKNKAYYTTNRDTILEKARLTKYGIGSLEVGEMCKQQHNCCAICGYPFDTATPHVDHNHTTGRIRGLLCARCNRGIGSLREDVQILAAAIKYLQADE